MIGNGVNYGGGGILVKCEVINELIIGDRSMCEHTKRDYLVKTRIYSCRREALLSGQMMSGCICTRVCMGESLLR